MQRLLDEMRKDTTVAINIKAIHILKKLDIHLEMGWISLVPTMSMEELKSNYHFLFETRYYSEENLYNRFNLYDGCYYEHILQQKGLLSKHSMFYERFGYEFADMKEGIFANIIEQLRDKFIDVKRKTMRIQEKVSISGDYKDYLKIRIRQRQLWETIIPQLLDVVEVGTVQSMEMLEKEKFYEDFIIGINKLAKAIEEG